MVGLLALTVRVILPSRVYCLTSRQAIVRPPAPNQQPPLSYGDDVAGGAVTASSVAASGSPSVG